MTDKELQDAISGCIERVKEVQDFLNDWYGVNDLFETAANAGSVLLGIPQGTIAADDMKWLRNLIDQHVMMANLLKKFEHGEERA